MNVTLSPDLEHLIQDKVDSGLYGDASEVVSEALRLLDERDRVARLRRSVEEAQAQVARGEYTRLTPGLIDEIKARAAENARLGKPVNDDVKL